MAEHEVRHRLAGLQAALPVAERLLEQAASADAGSAEQEYFLGMAAYELEAYRDALSHLAAAMNLAPSSETAARLALTHWRLDEWDYAEEWILKAIESDPMGFVDTLVFKSRVSYQAIAAHVGLYAGKVEAANAAALLALDLDEADALALSVLGEAHAIRGDLTAATKHFDLAIDAAVPAQRHQLVARRNLVANLDAGAAGLGQLVADGNAKMVTQFMP